MRRQLSKWTAAAAADGCGRGPKTGLPRTDGSWLRLAWLVNNPSCPVHDPAFLSKQSPKAEFMLARQRMLRALLSSEAH